MPNHPKYRFGWLDAVLELIDNVGVADPCLVDIRNNYVQAGPNGANRLYAMVSKRNITHFRAIVNTEQHYDWFGDCELIEKPEQIISKFRSEHLPDDYGINEQGCAYWWTKNVYDPVKIINDMKVSQETKQRLMAMIEEEKRLRMI